MKLYRIHLDVSLKIQNGIKKLPLSYVVFADSEQQAKNIARHISLAGVDVGKCKEECPGLEIPNTIIQELPKEISESIKKY